MGKLSRKIIVAELKRRNVEFDEDAGYGELVDLLKDSQAEPAEEIPAGEPANGEDDGITGEPELEDGTTGEEEAETKKQDGKTDSGQAVEVAEQTGFSFLSVIVARNAGFTFEQIVKFPSEEALRAKVISVKPRLALKFREKPAARAAAAAQMKYTDEVVSFWVELLAGMSSATNRAMNEQKQIEAEIRRRGLHNIVSINITRYLKPDHRNKVRSVVMVNYKKEV